MKILLWKKKENLWRLALISFLALFLELLIIRLVGTEIRIFAYVSNLVLLATFIGSGVGLINRNKYKLSATALLVFAVGFVLTTAYIVRLPNLEFKLFTGITELLAPLSEAFIWYQLETFSKTGIVIGLLLAVALFWLIMMVFVPIGSSLGIELDKSKRPLLAYSVNIVASLLGMWAFNVLSMLGISPYFGIFVSLILIFILAEKDNSRIYTLIAIVATAVMLQPRSAHQPYEDPVTFWSPYQKLNLALIERDQPYRPSGWFLEVNNVGFMGLLDLSDNTTEARRTEIEQHFKEEPLAGFDWEFSNQYTLPYKINPETKSVLIVGGGGGNDAAAAVREQIPSIKVVEIDPMIVALGKKYHPEKPYASSSVSVEVNDGRAFIEKTKEKFDVVIMSLADSHTLSSSMTNLQLDNYLYTLESQEKVKQLLSDNGIYFLSFEVTRSWIGERLQRTSAEAFDHPPYVFSVRSDGALGWGGVVFLNSKNEGALVSMLNENPKLKEFIYNNRVSYATDISNPADRLHDPDQKNNEGVDNKTPSSEKVNLLTDDWPYIYLDKPRVPRLHLILALVILGSLLLMRQRLVVAKGFSWSFFFLGAGFMLYEFQNISKSSLVFGNTWMTNLFVISGVMVFILVANVAVEKKLLKWRESVWGLVISLVLQFVVQVNWFNQFEGVSKIVVAMALLNLPHFFSALVFAHLFNRAKSKAIVFGSNLLGSAVGGFFEMLSFLFGVKSLLVVTTLFYLAGIAGLKKSK